MARSIIDEISNSDTVVLGQLTQREKDSLLRERWKCRTDAWYLATRVLGLDTFYEEAVHRPLFEHLQKFPKPKSIEQAKQKDKILAGTWQYEPLTANKLLLPGPRRRLILDSRAFGKTLTNSTVHSIQWIINYPEISMIIIQANLDKSIDILKSIKEIFTNNGKFRALFPEHVPPPDMKEWGTQQKLTTCARPKNKAYREPTLTAMSIEKSAAGMHVDVLKFSDIVDELNSQTKASCENIVQAFDMWQNILHSNLYWIDVEGTRYNYADLYGQIMNSYYADKKEGVTTPLSWSIYARGCYKADMTEPYQFTPEELDLPHKKDENGQPISWFPSRHPTEVLEVLRRENPDTFASQKLNNPIGGSGGILYFPNDPEENVLSLAEFTKIPLSYRDICIDTAFTENTRSNYTAIVVAAVDRHGMTFIENIIHGKYLPDELCSRVLAACKTYKPRKVLMEEIGFNVGLMPTFRRHMDMTGDFYTFELFKRDNQVRKEERILNTLQPWYKSKGLRFIKDLIPQTTWEHLKRELKQFPKGSSDDILDALADLFQGRKWFGMEFDMPVNPVDGYVRINPGAVGDPFGNVLGFRYIQGSPSQQAIADLLGIHTWDPDKLKEIAPEKYLSPENLHEYYRSTGGL